MPNAARVPSGSTTSSVPPSSSRERALEDRDRDALEQRGRAAGRLGAHVAHVRTDPSPGMNGGLWWNGTRFSQSRSACQWISAITCSGISG